VLCQLSYTPDKFRIPKFKFRNSRDWLRGRDLNPRPLGYEPNELPDCSTPRQSQLLTQTRFLSEISNLRSEISMVGLGRVELPTSRLSGVRSKPTELQAHLFRAILTQKRATLLFVAVRYYGGRARGGV
jgi:hypothetical protein